MKIRSQIFGVLAAGCLMGVSMPHRAAAEVSDDDFNKLKDMVQQLGGKVQALEETHEQDQQTIHALQQQVIETKQTASSAEQKAEDASASKMADVSKEQPAVPALNENLASHDFMIVGDAEVQFGQTLRPTEHSSFTLADFAPIFLFRASDNVLFEAGFDVTLANNAPNSPGYTTTVNLSFGTIDYIYNDHLTMLLGILLLPLGTYSERGAGWLNKIPDSPLPRNLLPGSGVGIEARGSEPLGESGQMLTYALYGVNGPGSVDGSGNASQLDLGGNVGTRSDGIQANLHSDPSGGGRIGWFYPWKPHYDFEIGVSGQAGEWDNAGNDIWSATVVDAALHLSPFVEVKGEYINTWAGTDDMGTINPRGWWIQAGYKLGGLLGDSNFSLPFINLNSLELVGRYDTSNDGLKLGQGTRTDRETAGFVYYISNTLWFEGDYEWLSSHGPNALPGGAYIFQLSYGF